MSILGNRVIRSEDPRFLRDGGAYVGDLDLPGKLHALFVRSTVANGAIESIDVDDATSAPGVVAVLTSGDLTDLAPYSNPDSDDHRRPVLATDRVRYSGEPVAVVIAETYEQAVDAAELVLVDIDPDDAVTAIDEALGDEVLVDPRVGTNITEDNRAGDLDFSESAITIDALIANSRYNAAPMEPRVAAASVIDGRLTCWTSTQSAHMARNRIAGCLGVEAESIRVITADVGGSFGSKASPSCEEVVVAEACRRLGRPVVWVETRTENLLGMGSGRSQHNRIRLGGTRDGRVTHCQFDIRADAGAFPQSASFLPSLTKMMATGVYDFANAACGWITAVTNTAPIVAFHGAGRPEAAATLERAIDVFAAEAGLDPAAVRRTNMIARDAFPFTTPMGPRYDTGDYVGALDLALEQVGYGDLRAEQAERRRRGSGTLLGIGVASYVEITAPGSGAPQSEYGSVTLEADGRVTARTGSTPYGQGHETTWAMIVADRMGVPLDRVTVIWGDTDEIPSSNITGGSRSVQLAGSAMVDAADRLIDAARIAAAAQLEAAPDDMVFDRERAAFQVAGSPSSAVGWSEVAAAQADLLVGVNEWTQDGATFPFGTHVAVVEIDSDTGGVVLRRFVTVDDAGTIINPLLAEGQLHGGIASGISQALFEEMRYDEFGNLSTANFADYAAPAASEFPSFEVTMTETPTPLNPLGAKGIGEAGSIGATPAVHNAVVDAMAHLGVRHIDIPLTPAKVWAAYVNATAASPE